VAERISELMLSARRRAQPDEQLYHGRSKEHMLCQRSRIAK
jgi:hypothetical protein